jgi:hypothetical protein
MLIKELHFWTPGVPLSDCYVRVDNKSPEYVAKLIRYQTEVEGRECWEFCDRETSEANILREGGKL